MAALGSDYQKNRDYLLGVLRRCSVNNTDCDEDTAGFLVQLYERGHHELLGALLAAGLGSDGALSEMLGDFYGEVVTKDPSAFIEGIRQLDAPAQKEVCWLAGNGDGGGMSGDPDKVRRELRRIGDEVALRCLREVEDGNRAGEASR